MNTRRAMIAGCLKEVSDWLTNNEGQVAIYDATNITIETRKFTLKQLPSNVTPIFLEVRAHEFLTIFLLFCYHAFLI